MLSLRFSISRAIDITPGLSRKSVAEASGISPTYLGRYLNGGAGGLAADKLEKVMSAAGLVVCFDLDKGVGNEVS